MKIARRRCLVLAAWGASSLLASCAPRNAAPGESVGGTLQQRRGDRAHSVSQTAKTPAPESLAEHPGESIGTVNGRPIDRGAFVELLIRCRGAEVFEQLVGLSAAEARAAEKGVSIDDEDIRLEEDLALRRLLDPLANTNATDFDREEAEELLDAVLTGRMMSRNEYLLTVRRNALLRKIVAQPLTITDGELKAESELVFGERVQVRHVQLASLGDASRIRERLGQGEDFAELATRYSTNAITARRGGLLEPFSLRDEDIPQAFRDVAARLKPGEVADLIRVGEWFHIIRLERRIPAESRDFQDVRDLLRRRLVVRRTEAPMRKLYEELFRKAVIEIADPTLREVFRAAHPELFR